MRKEILIGIFLVSSLLYGKDDIKNSKWTGQIVPRFEIEDTNKYGEADEHPLWIKLFNGSLKNIDYPEWTFIYELRHAEWNTSYFGDGADGRTEYRVYLGIQYSKKVTDKLTLSMAVRDRWQLQEKDDKTNWKVNSYRIAPGFIYQITDRFNFHGQVYLMKDIFYDRSSEKSSTQRNSTGYEVTGIGFLYRFADGMYFSADNWEEGWDKEHKNKTGDKMRHQQIRPRLSLNISEKDTLELYGRIQILGDQRIKDNEKGKIEVKRNRYGFDFAHKINDDFIIGIGFAAEPAIREKGYDGTVKKRDWYYYTGRIVCKF